MKRYTYFDGGKWRLKIGDTEYSGDWVDRLSAYEDTGLEPEDMKRAFNEDAVLKLAGQALGMSPDRLRDLAQAEKEGRLVVMPFSVAKHIYRIVDMKSHSAYNDFVTCERVLPFGIPIESILGGARIIPIEQFGKTVFLTREAAEAALDAMGGENNA